MTHQTYISSVCWLFFPIYYGVISCLYNMTLLMSDEASVS